MWRSNVLRLRKTSSVTVTTRIHGLKHTRWYSSPPSFPITNLEFSRALKKVLDARWDPVSTAPLGFAISGGVDSMALATLYARARYGSRNHLPPAHGFIVDHGVRPESAEEATWVAEQLREKLDMDSTILQLEWPEGFDLSNLRRFETEARRLRYQALGINCRNRGITSIMVAHHADDQAETVFMRLSDNRLRSGLQAMQSVEWIPECEGIHGVYHSGNPLSIRDDSLNASVVEQGGRQILRPLLGFEKARIIATCKNEGIPWAEDRTNQVQTLTARNAVRHIFKNHKLPEALSVQSLVNVSLHMQKRVESHKAYAAKLFHKCLTNLDIQTGTVHVRFPPSSDLLTRPIETESDRNEARNNAYYLLKWLAEPVSPRPLAPLDKLAATISNIYPELGDTGSTAPPSKNYCVYGVWWRASHEESPFPSSPAEDFDPTLPHPREWFLMRQPPTAREQRTEANEIVYSHSTTSRYILRRGEWRLFDGRFWIRIRNLTDDTLTLRLFTAKDRYLIGVAEKKEGKASAATTSFENNGTISPERRRWLSAALSLIKPSALHYTLPAVFRTDSTTGAETLLGFPTLNVCASGLGAPTKVCRWSVRYKKIGFGSRDPETIVSLRISKVELERAERELRRVREWYARGKEGKAGGKESLI